MIFNYPLYLHWDGKIMTDNEGNITNIEHIPVLVSGSEGTKKLLGVAMLQLGVESGTAGKHLAEVAINYVKEFAYKQRKKIQSLYHWISGWRSPIRNGT